MLNRVELTNFKKHEHLVATFKEGLIAIKGANEAGKSTLYHAVLYAMFGSRALPMTLAETVTYDKPESSLKVKLDFTFEGVAYSITRSKSGAQIVSSAGTANGQAEVTRYVENLFGVTADSATKLMIASQNGLRGALESNDAVALIEKLANLDLIDNLIKEVQAKLPCGNTSLVENNLEAYSDLKAPVLDTVDADATISLASGAVADLQRNRAALESLYDQAAVDSATDVLAEFDRQSVRLATLKAQIPALEAKARLELIAPPAGEVERLEAELQQEKQDSLLRKKYKEFQAVGQPAPLETVEAVDPIRIKRGMAKDQLAKLTTELRLAEAAVIKESSCGLCGKDLQNVPEVVEKNAALAVKAAALRLEIAQVDRESLELSARLVKAEAYAQDVARLELVAARMAGYVEVRYDPLRLQWVGGDVPEAVEAMPDTAGMLARAKASLQKYNTDKALKVEAEAQLAKANEQIAGIDLDGAAAAEAKILLAAMAETKESISVVAKSITSAEARLAEANWNKELVVKQYHSDTANYKLSLEAKAKLEAQLALMNKHNALIKKLRTVRPQVAADLWSIVLASVSTHFSTIRGTQSIVTRSADSFLVDGRPAKGLSGSTLDSLGLAIRVALNKTFLPSIQFLLLDEPAAGMSDEREAAMLGLLAALDYKQVLVVTHSNLADSFSADTVQI